MNILVFKTNIDNSAQVEKITPHLQTIQGIHKWNVDLHDCDNILRIESAELNPKTIEATLQKAGYYCEELVD